MEGVYMSEDVEDGELECRINVWEGKDAASRYRFGESACWNDLQHARRIRRQCSSVNKSDIKVSMGD